MPRPKKTDFKTKADYDNWYIKENKERINVLFEKGTKARIEATGAKVSEFIREAVEEKLKNIEK